jgi:hypothetical protein
MAQNIVFPEWLNSNSVRSYPITENCSRTDINGVFTIPNSLVVAAQISHSSLYRNGIFYISKLSISLTNITIFISFSPEDGNPEYDISSVNISISGFSDYSNYTFSGSGINNSIIGSLTIGNCKDTIKSGIGIFTFDKSSTNFEVNTTFVSIPALQYVEIYDSSGDLIYVSSDILKLKAGENIRLTYEKLNSDEYGSIRIDAIADENVIIEPNACENADKFYTPCIKTINGVAPDSSGRFWIDESDCIQIDEIVDDHSILIKDTCAKSCCGCADLSALTTALEALKDQEEQIRALVASTQSQQSEMLANIISNL